MKCVISKSMKLNIMHYFSVLLQQPWLTDIESNPEEAKLTLDALHDQLASCQKRAEEYRNYQKSFKVIKISLQKLTLVCPILRLLLLTFKSMETYENNLAEYICSFFINKAVCK